MRTVNFQQPYRRGGDGKLGARVIVSTTEHGWAGRYRFDTHGINEREAASKIASLDEHHRKKAQRLNGFAALQAVEWVVAGEVWRLLDVVIENDSDGGQVTLFTQAAKKTATGFAKETLVRSRVTYASIDQVPADAEIVAGVRAAIATVARGDEQRKHDQFAADVHRLVRGGGV